MNKGIIDEKEIQNYVGQTITLNVELGALKETLVWETHRRGRNWLAKVEKDPASPGGFKREFLKYAKGDYYYFVKENENFVIKVGDKLEWGADYYSARGKRYALRIYCEVISINDQELKIKIIKKSEI